MPRAKKSRVLFVGGGRRVSLAEMFVEHGATVLAYELDADAPVSKLAEVIVGADFDDPDCRPDIEKVVRKHRITHVVPLMDEAAVVCGDMPQCVGSPAGVSEICRDKLHFANWMEKQLPDLYPSPGFMRYPKFAKPRFGRSSRQTRVLDRPATIELSTSWVIQDYLDGEEVSVDVFVSGGRAVGAVARTRDRVEGGEAIESTVVEDRVLHGVYTQIACQVAESIGIRGPANVQIRGGKVIEVNPRFGGGSVLAVAAGLDLVGLCLGLVDQKGGFPIRYGLRMRRYHAESFA